MYNKVHLTSQEINKSHLTTGSATKKITTGNFANFGHDVQRHIRQYKLRHTS